MSDPCKIPLPANRPSSEAEKSRLQSKETLFNTITSDDWKRSLALARQQQNAVSEQIRTAISSSLQKTK
jgi:hypothetical protein